MADSHWLVGDLAIPLPAAARIVEEKADGEGRRRCSFRCSRFTMGGMEGACDAWARKAGFRTVLARSHDRGFARDYVSADAAVRIGFSVISGDAAAGEILLDRSAAPVVQDELRALEVDGVRFPLPVFAIPDVHDDLRDLGGDDLHDFFVPESFGRRALSAVYVSWALREGFDLIEQADDADFVSLLFRRGSLRLQVSLYACLDGGPATLRLGIGSEARQRRQSR
jgi:hypothetical protein